MKQKFWLHCGIGLSVVLFFALLAWWQLAAINGQWSTGFLGGCELEGWLWRYWWMKKMLTEVWTSTASFGYCLWVTVVAGSYPETGNVFDLELLSWPLEAVFGDPLYYNVKCLLVLTLNGVAGYLLGYKLLRSKTSALVCGLVLALSPYCLDEIDNGRVRQAILFPVVFYTSALISLWHRPSWATAVCAGLWAGISSAIYLYYGMAAALFTFIFVVWCALSRSYGRVTLSRFGYGVAGLAVAMLCCAPFAGSYIDRQLRGQELPELMWMRDFPSLQEMTSPDMNIVLKQNDPLLNSIQRFRSDSLPWQYAFMPRYSRNLPWLFSLLALLAWPVGLLLYYWRKRSRSDLSGEQEAGEASESGLTPGQLFPWLLGALFFYLLTLGPYLKDGSTGSYLNYANGGVASPYIWLFKYLPAFARLFSPVRMSSMLLVCVGVLSGAMIAQCRTLFNLPRFLRLMVVGMVTFLAAHGLSYCGAVPLSVSRLSVPQYYRTLAQQDYCTIVELPFRTGDSLQYYQTVHEKKLLLGWSDGAVPPGFPRGRLSYYTHVFNDIPNNSFFQFLESLNVAPDATPDFTRDDYLYLVEDAQVRYLIVHERGCHMINEAQGHEHYQKLIANLEEMLGPPVDVCPEIVDNGTFGNQVFEMSVFEVIREQQASGSEQKKR